ncbi:prepilin-type N-terminal cleavage/methylation domain-containing protein [Terribacillus halophilus]|uniref:Prepilin-type N-terminal cleavage/methylation domain-containing protein n=1 Tax=Terribacillus halophilus TaxID=361279 RepID=A0A1G6SF42_9BACI|nr:prepilin-type N-terminal cleavage/methylation domain-containing protein [Terribacillus halophilus]SDD15502.1 prepilin-type N-terminal cleavage/methylation domain-containing protein [Terribacillus halophilus]
MSNEKGFTLVELLAGLLLFSIVTIAAVSLVVQSMHNSANAEATNSLRNDATYVTQVLRSAYENGTLDGMCLEEDQVSHNSKTYKLVSGEKEIDLLLSDRNGIKDLQFTSDESENTRSECFNSQSETQTLQVKFTTFNDRDETFVLDTAFYKPTEEELNLSIADPGPPIPPEIPSPPSQCKENPGLKGDYYGDTKINDSVYAPWTYCSPFTVHNGSLWVTNSVNLNSNGNKDLFEFNVEGFLFVDNDFRTDNSTRINVQKDTDIKGSITLVSNTIMNTRALKANSLTFEHVSILNVMENLNILQSAIFKTNSILNVGSSMSLGSTTVQNSAVVNVKENMTINGNMLLTGTPKVLTGGNALFKGEYLSENNSQVEAAKDVTVEKKLNLKGNSKLYAKGNISINSDINIQDEALLVSDGDIHIKGNITPNNGGGTICAKGSITMDNPNKSSDIKILPNDQKCQK